MKNIITILFILFGMVASTQAKNSSYRNYYPNAVIFLENDVEFAIYPNGEFDFYYNPQFRRNNIVEIRTPHVNISYNSGYNYDPYIQYDDFGAVIQIENTPIYYDYYGRISQAGNVVINYNRFGRLASVGNLFVGYNSNLVITSYRGFINTRNTRYIPRPWHQYYRRPTTSIVYSRPYRTYYRPNRIVFRKYRKRYRNNHYSHKKDFYRPGQKVRSYNRGVRTTQRRKIRSNRSERYSRNSAITRSNRTKKENRTPAYSTRTRENHRIISTRKSAPKTRSSRSRASRTVSQKNNKNNKARANNTSRRNESISRSTKNSRKSVRSSRQTQQNNRTTTGSSRSSRSSSRSTRGN
ncbi:hypothetical protein [Zunongwangia sp.]|uniref:hypothetical protein n=1 Tax=Zunongwangia sp. TaxID=1965325 RepID=UPI003AA8205D